MLYNHFTEELLGLQGVKITNVEQEENLIIHREKERKRHNCICRGTATDTIHDYRLQKIKDIPVVSDTSRPYISLIWVSISPVVIPWFFFKLTCRIHMTSQIENFFEFFVAFRSIFHKVQYIHIFHILRNPIKKLIYFSLFESIWFTSFNDKMSSNNE